ncbi:MAG TPA: DNA-formamidopyrimidine glycosylase family protein [Capsulimonadaceae bacterium]|nr:DNA-formamidopyrimidine glycosylase family protein [Capsulimonadaceae bacterium]
MPEGDTIYRTATVLRKALVGAQVSRFETCLDTVQFANSRRPIAGRRVEAVEPRGKHLLIVFRSEGPAQPTKVPDRLQLDLLETDMVLHTHLRMTGSWHIYRPGEAWQKPQRYAKAVITTPDFVAPCFSAPVVELLSARETARHQGIVTLGPDAITPEFDPVEARSRLRRRADLEIGIALMDQRAMAGVGNVFKSEIMFIRRVSPFTKVRDLSDEVLDGLIEESHRLLGLNKERGARRTMFHLDNRQLLWAYGRSGEPCRVCQTRLRMRRQGLDGRSTYYCPQCQQTAPY